MKAVTLKWQGKAIQVMHLSAILVIGFDFYGGKNKNASAL
ncbi:hypothetical protein PROPEN_01373 [Proteus penneri ATCC 35198]|nr:hypothetical protein PROPEN_01373 [Proteus penneri ATCC 35198]